MADNIAGKTISGVIWVGIERASVIIIQFIIGIILARILDPSDFGLIGMIVIFMAIADTMVDSGFANALIQKNNVSNIDYSTALFFNASVGISLYAILYILSPNIAEFYNEPILKDIIRVYALLIIINSFIGSQLAKLSIELKFRTQSLITIFSNFISGIIGIVLAYNNYGVWALVFQSLCGAVLRLIFITIVARINFQMQFSKASFKELWHFGSNLLFSSMINTIYNNIYSLVIGKTYNSTQVGYYNRADQFSRLPSNTLTSIIIRVIYPILSKVQNDNTKLASVYIRFVKFIMFALSPIMTILFVLADQIIIVTVGEQWLGSAPLLRALCGCYLIDSLTHLNLNLLYVKARTDIVLKLELIKKPIGFILLFASIQYGVIVMCIGQTLYSIIAFSINCTYTNKILDEGLIKQVGYITPIFLRSLIMGIIIYLFISMLNISPLIQLLIGTTIAFIVYIVLAFVCNDESLFAIKDYYEKYTKKVN